ncbi:hypothetical protein DMI65_08800 [Escherichia coli]|nr:hypothetical protein [Escherichia coli]
MRVLGLKEKCEYHPRKRGRRKKRINNLSECSEPANGEWKSLGRRKDTPNECIKQTVCRMSK